MHNRLPIPLHIDPTQPQLHQLVAQLRKAVRSGALEPQWRMPPSRVLAQQLGVGRDTVVQAYADLCTEGCLVARGRKGTYVAAQAPTAVSSADSAAPKLARRLQAPQRPAVAAHHDWRLGQACTLDLPLPVWRAACKEAGRYLPPTGYGDPLGDAGLRAEIANWLQRKRGVVVQPAQIVVTQGAAQAIELLALLLLRAGDVCAVENPGYVRATQAFAARGARVVHMPVDAQGAQVQAVFDGPTPPVVLHITPAHHYPLGMRLASARRHNLLALAQRHRTLVIENEYDHEFAFAGANTAPLLASAPGQVLLVSTFAKAISPALRLGFVVAPQPIAARLGDLIEAENRHASWPVQRSVAWLLGSGELDRHLRRLQRHFEALRSQVREAVSRLGGYGLQIQGDSGGLHVLLHLRSAQASLALETRLRGAGVQLHPLRSFSQAAHDHHGVLLGYGHMSSSDLQQALQILGTCVAHGAGVFSA